MKRNVTQYDFTEAFRGMGRGDSFSYEGRKALYDYLIQYEEDCGEEIELDVIGLCCDYSEYGTALEAAKEYGFKLEGPNPYASTIRPPKEDEEDEQEEVALDWLEERTSVIAFDGGVIIQGF